VTNYGIVGVTVLPNGDTTGEAKLIMGFVGKGIRHLSLTADGKKLAYASLEVLSTLTALPMSPASSEPSGPPAELSNDRSPRHVVPSYSRDGRRITFAQWREGSGADIWLIDTDGKNLTQVTADPAIDNVPNWFPEGDRLEFISNRRGQFDAWSISLVSGKESLLADLGLGVGGYARLSPDGTRLAFNSNKSGTINVWLKTIGGGESTQLTFDTEMTGFPCWSPDGKTVAVEVKRGPNDYLAIVPTDGGPPVQLVSEEGLSWPHDWSRDGDKVLFAGQRHGIWNIYWVSRSTKEQKQLTHYSRYNAFTRYPAWSPSGDQIVYEYAETTGNVWVMELK
jgi:Tol biopolymer transport system component